MMARLAAGLWQAPQRVAEAGAHLAAYHAD